jgi:hypothetical protein
VPGAEITNCGCGSFLFTTDFKKFHRKIMVAEEFFCKLLPLLILFLGYFNQKRLFSRYLLKLSGAGRNIFGSATLVHSQHFRPQWNMKVGRQSSENREWFIKIGKTCSK